MSNRMMDFPLTRLGRLTVNVKAVAPDTFLANCESLAGCVAYGRTRAETKLSMAQAVLKYLAGHDIFLLVDPVNIIDFNEV